MSDKSKVNGNKRRLPKALRAEQVADFFRYGFDGDRDADVRDYAMFALMYRSGLRVGEAVSLSVSDLDTETGLIHVPNVDGRSKVGERSTYVGMNDEWLLDALGKWMAVRARWSPKSDFLFVSRNGTPLHPNNVYRSILTRSERVGIGHVTPHQLRHTFAHERLDQGWDLPTLQHAMGHKKLQTTAIYLEKNPMDVRNAWGRTNVSNPLGN